MADSNKIDYIQERLEGVATSVAKIDKDNAIQRIALEEHTKSDEKMYEELKRMNDILQQNTDSLKEHMHRSDLLEDLVHKMDKRISPIELERVQRAAVKDFLHKNIKFIAKIGAAALTIAGAWIYIKPILDHFFK
jgi:DNA replication protein DnaD